MIPQMLSDAIEKLARDMPLNATVRLAVEGLKQLRAQQAVTAMVTRPEVVTRTVTPQRDRAKYMRDYRARSKAVAS